TLLICLLCCGQSYAEAEKILVVNGGTSIPRPPYRWIDQCSGKVIGSIPHLLGKIFTPLNIKYRYTAPSVDDIELSPEVDEQLENGEIDARIVYGKNPANSAVIYSQQPISVIKLAVFYPRSAATITRPQQLRQLRGVAISPLKQATPLSPLQNYLRQQGLPFILAATEDEAIELIKTGQADYVLTLKYNQLLANYSFQRLNITGFNIHFYLAIAANSDYADIMPEIDYQIEQAIASGLVDFLDRKYLMLWLERGKKACTESLLTPEPELS
ncbi:hypothetical protein LCGC14_2405370, partial [marine sediment metagenome]